MFEGVILKPRRRRKFLLPRVFFASGSRSAHPNKWILVRFESRKIFSKRFFLTCSRFFIRVDIYWERK